MKRHLCTAEHVTGWEPPFVTGDPDKGVRDGWTVRCSVCGPLSDGWAYWRAQDACAVATKHERRHARIGGRA